LEKSKTSNRVNGVSEQMNGKRNQGRSHVSSYLKRLEVDLTKCHWQVRLNFCK